MIFGRIQYFFYIKVFGRINRRAYLLDTPWSPTWIRPSRPRKCFRIQAIIYKPSTINKKGQTCKQNLYRWVKILGYNDVHSKKKKRSARNSNTCLKNEKWIEYTWKPFLKKKLVNLHTHPMGFEPTTLPSTFSQGEVLSELELIGKNTLKAYWTSSNWRRL